MRIRHRVFGRVERLAPRWIYGVFGHPDAYLGRVDGVIHVGANVGQERYRYRRFGLRVLWIEPIPWIFDELVANISGFKGQSAYQALVTDVDGRVYEFHVADNAGASSSVYELAAHQLMWPDVGIESSIELSSLTLPRVLEQGGYELVGRQALVLDTQGAELLVLRGTVDILHAFDYIKTEVADFEAYSGCCQLPDLAGFLAVHGFREEARVVMATSPSVGTYFEILYAKEA